MASIGTDPNGHRRILFVAGDGKRKTIRLGKVTPSNAQTAKENVEALLSAKVTGGTAKRHVLAWLDGLDDVLYDRFVAVGLADVRQRAASSAVKLAPFCDGYIAGRTGLKPSTMTGLKQTRADLVAHFGADRDIRSITEGDAEDFQQWLAGGRGTGVKKAANTVRRRCGRSKQFFGYAVRKKLITSNPFDSDKIKCSVRENRAREFFVTREMAQKVIDACPDNQWRLLFVLSRFGGLRCPSEHLALKWGDVTWGDDDGSILVHSSKTEHIEGKETRLVPLFPEIRPYLQAVYDEAEEGTEYVITRYRDKNANLRTQLNRIIRKAGLSPWPKLFHNLRGTRETELAGVYPLAEVCEWIGNSVDVARKHYLQATDAQFKAAVRGTRAAHDPAQCTVVPSPAGSEATAANPSKSAVLVPHGTPHDSTGSVQLASIGVEPILLLGNGF